MNEGGYRTSHPQFNILFAFTKCLMQFVNLITWNNKINKIKPLHRRGKKLDDFGFPCTLFICCYTSYTCLKNNIENNSIFDGAFYQSE